MKTIYAYDKKTGECLGGFSEGNTAIPKECGITEIAPEHGLCKFIDGVWIFPVEIKREMKIFEIKKKRDEFQTAPITINGKEYKATKDAKAAFLASLNARADSWFSLEWRLSDDITWVSLSESEAYEIYSSFTERDKSGYKQESNFISKCIQCQTNEEIDLITVEYK